MAKHRAPGHRSNGHSQPQSLPSVLQAGPSPEEFRIKHRIDEIYTQHPFLGSRRIAAILNREEVKAIAILFRSTCEKWDWLRSIPPEPEQTQFAASHLSASAARLVY
nr:transposase [Thermosporothrix hazakensis]